MPTTSISSLRTLLLALIARSTFHLPLTDELYDGLYFVLVQFGASLFLIHLSCYHVPFHSHWIRRNFCLSIVSFGINLRMLSRKKKWRKERMPMWWILVSAIHSLAFFSFGFILNFTFLLVVVDVSNIVSSLNAAEEWLLWSCISASTQRKRKSIHAATQDAFGSSKPFLSEIIGHVGNCSINHTMNCFQNQLFWKFCALVSVSSHTIRH